VGWSDVGSWSSLWELAPRDGAGNFTNGAAVLEDTHDSYIHSEKALVATIGVRDLIIVDTPDALLVGRSPARAGRLQDRRAACASPVRKEQEQHLKNHRPWGHFETLNIGPRFQVKLLHVKPGGQVVHADATITAPSTGWLCRARPRWWSAPRRSWCARTSRPFYIVATQWHRLENPGKTPLEMIEVQIGSYLGEDDSRAHRRCLQSRSGRDEVAAPAKAALCCACATRGPYSLSGSPRRKAQP